MNTALYGLYDDKQLAEQARAKLIASGIKPRAIQTLALSSEERDHAGGFGDTEAHMHGAERDHAGGFGDTEAHMHSAERDHAGGFGDTEAHMHGAERDHAGSFASHRHPDDILRELSKAGIADGDAQACLMRMAQGAMLLLVQPSADQIAQAAEILRA